MSEKSNKPKNTTRKITKRPIVKNKDELVTGDYKYKPEKDEKLIVDKPSVPLSRINKNVSNSMIVTKSNKELYESYIKDLRNFSLSVNGEVMYDSSIDRSKNNPLLFDNDYFVLYGKKYSYNGLRIQKIN